MRLTNRRRVRGGDDGFTLVELMLTIAIMGVVTAALTGVVISYLKTTTDTQSRLTESQDVQLAAAYWQRDVASIGVRTYNAATKEFDLARSVDVTPACTLPPGDRVVTLAWSEYDAGVLDSTVNGATVTVSYVAQPDAGGYDLLRVRCTGSTVDSVVEVAHSLDAEPVPGCDVACAGVGANVPTIVTLQLSVRDPDGNGTTAQSATLTGERRQS